MSSNADAIIAALRSGHDELVTIVGALRPDQLTGPSRASEWDLSQVISHLGSGAEIGLGTLNHAVDPAVPAAVNEQVWDRWNAMTPAERAAAFPAVSEAGVSAYEALDESLRNDLRIELSYLPAPIDLAFLASMRLNEQALHSWDVRAQLDPAATLPEDAVAALIDRSGALLGWIGQAGELDGDVHLLVETTGPARTFGLAITDTVTKGDPPERPDATLRLPAEAWLRLTAGRLKPDVTPPGVSVSGAVTLDDLRRVFPGY